MSGYWANMTRDLTHPSPRAWVTLVQSINFMTRQWLGLGLDHVLLTSSTIVESWPWFAEVWWSCLWGLFVVNTNTLNKQKTLGITIVIYVHTCRIQIWPSLARTYLKPKTWWTTRPHAQLSSATLVELSRTWRPAKIILGRILRVCSWFCASETTLHMSYQSFLHFLSIRPYEDNKY